MNLTHDSGFALPRFSQNFDKLLERCFSTPINFLGFNCADGMLDDQDRMIRCSKCRLFGFRQRLKRMRDYSYGEPSALL